MSHTRRDFLKASLGASTLLSLGAAAPALLSRSALAAAPKAGGGDTVLIVVQLAGGNDGLNTLVPYGDDEYYRKRPTVAIPADQLHKVDSFLGFHPRMHGFKRLYDEGHLSVVQGVGYPNPSGDHAVSMRNWQTGKPHETSCQTGWLGRAADSVYDPELPELPAVFVGRIRQPFTLNAERAIVPSIRSLEEYTLQSMPGPGGEAHRRRLAEAAELSRADGGNKLLEFVKRTTLAGYALSRKVEAVIRDQASTGEAEYPSLQLAQTFRQVAQVIRADLGIRIIYTVLGGEGFGGFDNHANQIGNHCAQLHQLSESVAAFVDDLKRDNVLDRVLLMTLSEFGRTVAENGRRGTDHGSGAPLFVAGGGLKGGLVGPHPSLTKQLQVGGPKFHTDFRRVYATMLESWLGFDSRAVLSEAFQPLDLLSG